MGLLSLYTTTDLFYIMRIENESEYGNKVMWGFARLRAWKLIDIHRRVGSWNIQVPWFVSHAGRRVHQLRSRARERLWKRDCERDRARLWMQERDGRVNTPPSQDLILTAQPIFYLHHGGGKRLWGEEEKERRTQTPNLYCSYSRAAELCFVKRKKISCERIWITVVRIQAWRERKGWKRILENF